MLLYCWKDYSRARAIAANDFPEVDFSANTESKLALTEYE